MSRTGRARNGAHHQKCLSVPSKPLARTPKSAAAPSPEGSAALLSFQSSNQILGGSARDFSCAEFLRGRSPRVTGFPESDHPGQRPGTGLQSLRPSCGKRACDIYREKRGCHQRDRRAALRTRQILCKRSRRAEKTCLPMAGRWTASSLRNLAFR
jgi:hypothetical protein